MIKYALICEAAHEFEAWFSSSSDYQMQEDNGLLICPHCQTANVKKAIMAPAVKTTKGQDVPSQAQMFEAFAGKMRKHIKDSCDYVGEDFATEARAMHDGQKPERGIYGKATPKDAQELAEDGVPVTPIPAALAPVPDEDLN